MRPRPRALQASHPAPGELRLETDFKNTAARDIRRGGAASNAPALGTLARELRGSCAGTAGPCSS
ncbi:hypothetical protein [Streptomyces sp. NBC_01429]|uniref:hypothetical protein n=1 Tax=Streptomyces sp. NBC_01429 TaxID=2903862 RepID=UPI002E2CB41C|nr:hypothetical protein [Streptomyces sp. NBC_01429]